MENGKDNSKKGRTGIHFTVLKFFCIIPSCTAALLGVEIMEMRPEYVRQILLLYFPLLFLFTWFCATRIAERERGYAGSSASVRYWETCIKELRKNDDTAARHTFRKMLLKKAAVFVSCAISALFIKFMERLPACMLPDDASVMVLWNLVLVRLAAAFILWQRFSEMRGCVLRGYFENEMAIIFSPENTYVMPAKEGQVCVYTHGCLAIAECPQELCKDLVYIIAADLTRMTNEGRRIMNQEEFRDAVLNAIQTAQELRSGGKDTIHALFTKKTMISVISYFLWIDFIVSLFFPELFVPAVICVLLQYMVMVFFMYGKEEK